MNKFITPVSMQVTQEQYEKDLKKPLNDLGYSTTNISNEWLGGQIIVNNPDEELGKIIPTLDSRKHLYNRHFINHYNPKLFLALAAMTEDDKPIVGEYVIASIGSVEYLVRFNRNRKSYDGILGDRWICLSHDYYRWIEYNSGGFTKLIRKATKEELIKHLTMDNKEEFVLPKNYCIEVTDENQEVLRKHFKISYSIRKNYAISIVKGVFNSQLYSPHDLSTYAWCHYGVLPEITFEQFKKYVLKKEIKESIYTIQDLAEGKVVCKNDGTLEELRAVLKAAFFTDSKTAKGDSTYYYTNRLYSNRWAASHKAPNLPIQSVKEFYKQLNQEKVNTKNRFPFSLQPIDAQIIIEAACSGWKAKLADKWAKQIVLNENIEISQAFYTEMRNACTKEQHILFDKIFGKDGEECVFKVGEYIMYNDRCYYVKKIDVHQGDTLVREISFMQGIGFISPSIKQLNKDARLWSVEDLKDGEPAWGSYANSEYFLRYSNGKGNFYAGQYKSGKITSFNYAMPFDPYNLPVNK